MRKGPGSLQILKYLYSTSTLVLYGPLRIFKPKFITSNYQRDRRLGNSISRPMDASLDAEIMSMSLDEIRQRSRLVENDVFIAWTMDAHYANP